MKNRRSSEWTRLTFRKRILYLVFLKDPFAPVAQGIEQQPSKLWVEGSSPFGRAARKGES